MRWIYGGVLVVGAIFFAGIAAMLLLSLVLSDPEADTGFLLVLVGLTAFGAIALAAAAFRTIRRNQ